MKNIKENIVIAFWITGSALLHVAPVVCIAIIATEGNTARAFATVGLTFSCIALGYVHGLNKTTLSL